MPSPSLRHGFLIGLEVTDYDSPASNCPSLPPHFWNCKCILLFPAFLYGF
ncbi:hypothetical protein ACRRTK_001982 [Alexandromys fortis]